MAAFEWHYEFACPTGLHKVSADTAAKVFEELRESESGLTPRSLLEFSKDPSSPTHCEFEWDDALAADGYRLQQARQLIIDLRIVHEEDNQRERAYVVTPERKSEYVPMEHAMSKEDLRNGLLNQARKDAEIFAAKYRRLEELAGVTKAIEEFVKDFEKVS